MILVSVSVGVSSCATPTKLIKPQVMVDNRLIIECNDLDDCPEVPGCYDKYTACLETLTEQACVELVECLEYDRTGYIWIRYKGLRDSIESYNRKVETENSEN